MKKLRLILNLRHFCILAGFFSAFLGSADTGVGTGKLSEVEKKQEGLHRFLFPDTSMAPLIHQGDSITVDFDYYSKNPIKRGDVVAVSRPDIVQGIYISRVIGLPTETISSKGDTFFISRREAYRKKIDEKQCSSIIRDISSEVQERAKQIACFEESLDGFKHVILMDRYPSVYNGKPEYVPLNNYYLETDNRFYFRGSHETAVVSGNQIIGKALTSEK
jgi:signal peptidase I